MMTDFLVYLLFRSFLLVVYFLPLRLNVIFGKFIGRAYYFIDRWRRRIIEANICVVFGRELDNKERHALGRESCECLAMNILDLLKLNTFVTPDNYQKFIEIKGLSNLVKSIQRQKGTIAVMGHFGNLVLVRYVCYVPLPTKAVIVRKLDNPFLDRFVNSIVKEHDAITVRPDGAIRKMFRLLMKNSVVLTLADQKAGGNPSVGRHGIVVDFFGIPSQTHITAPLLASRTGADILPLFIIRKGPGKYRIEINKPLTLVSTHDEKRDLMHNTRKLNQIFEDYIRRHPDHWFWLHRRWKDIPGLEDLYTTDKPIELIENFRRNQSKNKIAGEDYS